MLRGLRAASFATVAAALACATLMSACSIITEPQQYVSPGSSTTPAGGGPGLGAGGATGGTGTETSVPATFAVIAGVRSGLNDKPTAATDVTLGGFTVTGELRLWAAWTLPVRGQYVAGSQSNGISVFGVPQDTNDEFALWSSALTAGQPSPWRRTPVPQVPAWAGAVMSDTDLIAIASDTADHLGSDVSLLDLNQPTAWRSASVSLLTPRITTSVVLCGGYLFVVGGETRPEQNSKAIAAVESAPVTAQGLGNFASSADLQSGGHPLTRVDASVACTAKRIYVMGGDTEVYQTAGSVTVLSGAIQADGSVSAWEDEPALPYTVDDAASVVTGDYLVVAGGINAARLDTVAFAKLDAEGHVVTWRSEGNPKLPAGVQKASAVALAQP